MAKKPNWPTGITVADEQIQIVTEDRYLLERRGSMFIVIPVAGFLFWLIGQIITQDQSGIFFAFLWMVFIGFGVALNFSPSFFRQIASTLSLPDAAVCFFLPRYVTTVNPNGVFIEAKGSSLADYQTANFTPAPHYLPDQIDQIFVKRFGYQDGTGSTYNLIVMLNTGDQFVILVPNTTLYQALVLEECAEELLGIVDRRIKGEARYGLRQFAQNHEWPFEVTPGTDEISLAGIYEDCRISITSDYQASDPTRPWRFLVLTAQRYGDISEIQTPEAIQAALARLATMFDRDNEVFKYLYNMEFHQGGRILIKEWGNTNPTQETLILILEAMTHLVKDYPIVIRQGDAIIVTLRHLVEQTLKDDVISFVKTGFYNNDRRHPLALQYVTQVTKMSLAQPIEIHHRLCPQCLTQFKTYQLRTSTNQKLDYGACRLCQQGTTYLVANPAVLVLDQTMSEDYTKQETQLRLNWLKQRQLADVDQVEIIKAGDEDVERLVVAFGNDTDLSRKPGYQQMRCTVAADCTLSENTHRLLKHTFGEVKII